MGIIMKSEKVRPISAPYLQDALSGVRETMGFNRQAFEKMRFTEVSRKFSDSNLKAMYLWSVYSPGMIFVGSLGTVLVLWYGAGQVLQGDLKIGELVMFLFYLALFYTPVNQIHSVNHLLQHALAASERIFEVLDWKPLVMDQPKIRPTSPCLDGVVEFNNVSFSYRSDVPVLQEISLQVAKGEQIALIGPSGAGKSTLMKLLMRFYDVGGGAITIDGYDIRDLSLAYLRNQIGFVQQEPFLFNGTVRDNILYGDLARVRGILRRWLLPRVPMNLSSICPKGTIPGLANEGSNYQLDKSSVFP